MNRSTMLVTAAVALATAGLNTAQAAPFISVYGGLAGVGNQSLNTYSGAVTAGTGIAVGNAGNAQEITTSGVVQLGSVSGSSDRTTAYAVNNAGTIVGSYEVVQNVFFDLGPQAVEWTPSTSASTPASTIATALTTPTNTVASGAKAISQSGTIGGFITTSTGEAPIVWTSASNYTVLGTAGLTAYLPQYSIQYGQTTVRSISANGVYAAGSVATSTGKFSPNGTLLSSANGVLWNLSTNGAVVLQNYGTSSDGTSYAAPYVVNSSGYSVGYSAAYNSSGSSLGTVAVLWNPQGHATQLGGYGAVANSLNASNESVGYVPVTSSNDTRAASWDANGNLTTLGVLGQGNDGTSYASAEAVNDNGVIVGEAAVYDSNGNRLVFPAGSTTPLNHAVVWEGTTAIDLNSLIDPSSGWTLEFAYSITNDNWVSGIGLYTPDGNMADAYTRDFLIQLPSSVAAVPEPASLGTLALGAALLIRRKR